MSRKAEQNRKSRWERKGARDQVIRSELNGLLSNPPPDPKRIDIFPILCDLFRHVPISEH